MNTILTVAFVLAVAGAWRAWRNHRRNRRKNGELRPRRFAALMMAIAILGFQAVATAPPASAAACGEAPNPERPGAGLVGAIDPPLHHGHIESPYFKYGYGGMVWNTFQTNCGALSGLADPSATIDTWAGNQLFNLGKNIVGATNSLHYTVLENGLLSPIYNAVKTGAEKVYNNIYAQLFGIAALILAIFMFRNIWQGDLRTISKRALYGLAAVWLAASSVAMLRYLDPIDSAVVQTTTNIQAGFIDATGDHKAWDVIPTDLHDQVVYRNWLRGEFGSPDNENAKKFGPGLLDAQSFTVSQIDAKEDANQAVVDGKKAAFKNISTQLGPDTGYFTGDDGSRVGAGFLSLGQSLAYAVFQLLAKLSVLLAQVIIRLFVLTAPIIGLVALVHHDVLRRVAKLLGAVAFNLAILSVLAGVHALLLQAIFGAGQVLSMLTQMALASLVTILLFMVGRPVRRLWQMVEMSVSAVGGAIPAPSGGLFSRFRRKNQGPTPQDEFWANVRDTDEAIEGESRGPIGAIAGGGRFRPEATVFANSQRLDGVSGLSRPAAAWSGAPWPGGAGAVGGMPARAALPSGGSDGATAYSLESGPPGDYVLGPGGTLRGGGPSSRRVDTSPVFDRRWSDEPEPVVVPSRMDSGRGQNEAAYTVPPQQAQPGPQPGVPPAAAAAPEPRRAEAEMVAGKPVFVVYRPSRGLEVRQDVRDTDRMVR
ncbi:magnesium transporter [Amycolatopsis sp. CA-230715]|uniref:magnesium transporter n=1 Tax=Amycolatopsis sp. CA-230715 TaxID=2745196 RepID=UPI001C02B317|nr:magnesium transporter [Amycolatopsis sp. CA-230715]QWF79095.1 hypothetical protein HUW46_02502 [Amycolatopsis sp. CA-230715]